MFRTSSNKFVKFIHACPHLKLISINTEIEFIVCLTKEMWHIFVHSGVILMFCTRIVFCDASDKNDKLVFVHIVSK